MLNRRKFLFWGSCGVLGLAGIGAVTGSPIKSYLKYMTKNDVILYLSKHYESIDFSISDSQFTEFYEQYVKNYGPIRRQFVYVLNGKGTSAYQRKMKQLRDIFLLSTDYFIYPKHISRKVNYVTLYGAYVSPCWNPLSRKAQSEGLTCQSRKA